MKSLWLALLIGLLGAVASPAVAFTVGTGFTDPCHERFTMAAYYQTRAAVPVDQIPEPRDGPWESFIEKLLEDLEYPALSRKESFYFASLLAGVRANDTDGHSTINLNALRSLHVHPELQYEHFLRAPGDDYEEGNQAAIKASREQILAFFELMREFRKKDPAEQIIRVTIAVDFHGEIKVDAWAVAYYLGKALHTFHDSFSHTIRSPDLTHIVHVLNYAEAVTDTWEDQERDGIRHSVSLDGCGPDVGEILVGVLDSSVDLVFAATAFIDGKDDDLITVRAVMDKWLSYQPGCDQSNHYCDSPWAKRALANPTLPYLEDIFGCHTAAAAAGSAWPLFLLVLVGLSPRRRRR